MPSYAEILDLLVHLTSITTSELAAALGYRTDEIRPVLHRLEQTGHIKKIVTKHPKPNKWAIRKSFKIRLIKSTYSKPSDTPWIKAIEEKRKAHMGWCQICKKNHPYPHLIYPENVRRKRNKNLTYY